MNRELRAVIGQTARSGLTYDCPASVQSSYHRPMPSTSTRRPRKPSLRAAYPLAAVRALALYAQHLHLPNDTAPTDAPTLTPTRDDVYRVILQMGCVQIDTLQMVARSQYIALWSRLGRYDPADLDRLAFGDGGKRNTRKLFEYWLHAACLIPLTEFRYRLPVMRRHSDGSSGWWKNWLAQPGNAELLAQVRERVRVEGPLRGADFEHDGPRRGSWWDWKPAKHALERLYDQGELMIAGRTNFQRLYDLRERVLPKWVDVSEPTLDEMHVHTLEWAARALGVCQALQVSDFLLTTNRTKSKPYIEQLLKDGVLAPIQAELADGQTHELVVHRDHLRALEACADGAISAQRTTFLSPFDNVWWARRRDRLFWQFHQTLEAYVPAPKRRWGYFSLPILHKDRFVGRFDPKLERQTGVLRLRALHLEPGVKPDDELAHDMAVALQDFMAFHGATDLIVEQSKPAAFGPKLMKAMNGSEGS